MSKINKIPQKKREIKKQQKVIKRVKFDPNNEVIPDPIARAENDALIDSQRKWIEKEKAHHVMGPFSTLEIKVLKESINTYCL